MFECKIKKTPKNLVAFVIAYLQFTALTVLKNNQRMIHFLSNEQTENSYHVDKSSPVSVVTEKK